MSATLSEKTTCVSEDLKVAQDAFPRTAETFRGNSLDDHDKKSLEILDEYSGEPPDGGPKAWSVVLGASMTTLFLLGYLNTWAMYQEYYEHVILPDSGPSAIAWIGSVQFTLLFLPGLITGRILDMGYIKLPYFIASSLLLTCVFLTAECTTYWQFFLVQGVGCGLACGIMYGPAIGIVRHWFSKRSGLVLGIITTGTSFGGIIFTVVWNNLLPHVGFKWTVRVFGFMMLVAGGVANITIDGRRPPVNVTHGLFDWASFRNPVYTVYCMAGTFYFLGFYTVITYLPISATLVGMTNGFAVYLVAIASAASLVGRPCAGWLADRIGPLNVITPVTAVAGMITLVWPLATTQSSLTVVAVVYGLTHGAYHSLFVAPVFEMGEVDKIGRRTGMLLTFASVGVLTGPPISGAINARTGGYTKVGYYAGGIMIFSTFTLIVVRYLQLGRLSGKI